MLSDESRNPKIPNELDKEIPEEYFDAIATPLNDRNQMNRQSSALNLFDATVKELTEELEHQNFFTCPIGNAPDLSLNALLSDEDNTSFIPISSKNKSIVPISSNRHYVAENEAQGYNFAGDYLRKSLSKTSSIKKVKKLFTDILKAYNSVNISNSIGDQAHESQKCSLNILNFKKFFIQSLPDIINCQAVSYVLTNEGLLNIHLADATRPKSLTFSSKENPTRKIKKSVHRNCLAIEQSPHSESGAVKKCKINHQLNLLCVFTDSTNLDGITSDLSKPWAKEDIKIILPTTWNVVVAHNVVTVSHENNQNIRILFPKPLKTKVDYEKSNLAAQNYDLSSSSGEPDSWTDSDNSIALNDDTVKSKTLRGKATKINKESQKSNSAKGRSVHGLFSRKQDFLSLQKPLLLNYMQERKRKQILMYKDHSLQNVSKTERNKPFYEILQELLSKSVPYEGEPVNLVFDPSKLANKLEKEEKITHFLIRSQPSQSRQDLLEKSDFIQFIKKKSIKTESKELVTASSVANCAGQEGDWSSERSVIQCQKCLRDRLFRKGISTVVSMSSDASREISKRNTLRKSRTAMKRLNEKKVTSSVFRHFFHFYSLVGGRLQSGAVITRANSSYWLRLSGVAKDSSTLDTAEELFTSVAGRKVVLNIYDYLKFLMKFALRERITVTELMKQMMMCDISSIPEVHTPTNMKRLLMKCTEESQCSIH